MHFSDFDLVIDNDLLFISNKFKLLNWCHVRIDGNLTARDMNNGSLSRKSSFGKDVSLDKLLHMCLWMFYPKSRYMPLKKQNKYFKRKIKLK